MLLNFPCGGRQLPGAAVWCSPELLVLLLPAAAPAAAAAAAARLNRKDSQAAATDTSSPVHCIKLFAHFSHLLSPKVAFI